MHKIWLIIKREYLVRVRKKSFIIMTILGPLLMVGLLVLPAYLASESQEERIIAISEEEKEFSTKLKDTEYLHFTIIPESEANKLKTDFEEDLYYALIDIDDQNFTLYSSQQISLSVSSEIKSQIEQIIEYNKLKQSGIDLQLLEDATTTINMTTRIISKDGESIKSQAAASIGIGFFSGILIYIFIFITV